MDTSNVATTEYHYRAAPRRTSLVQIALRVDLAVTVFYLVASIAASFAPAIAKLAGPTLGLFAAVHILTLVSLFVWLHRATANVYAFGADISFDPPWAIGWLILPVVNIWMPFVVMEELWRASEDAHAWRQHTAPWAVIYWWAAWAASCLLGVLAYFTGGALVVKAGYLIATAAYLFLLAPIVEQIRDLQQTQAARNGLA
ncbi:MAG TPA: DUF4328 domain-containing protein [Rhizomicrobium sp.]|nr:DUF4328 domain-containing protein [Rhizomicrobium sp.]